MFTEDSKEVIYRDACNYQAHCWATERVCDFKDAVAIELGERGLDADSPACRELIEELVLREDVEVYSDVFRDVHGFRPRLELNHFRAHNRAERSAVINKLFDELNGGKCDG